MLRTVAVELCRLEEKTDNIDNKTSDTSTMDTNKSKDVETPTTSISQPEEKKDSEEPKPRIVLTFRSEKPGVKSSTMKIVSPEEKSTVSPKKSHINESDDSENLENTSKSSNDIDDSSLVSPKRSTRCRGKDSDIIASAIARKEKSYNEATPTTTATKRRIKPTEKALSNKEYKMLIHKNNRTITTPEKSIEGVQTRRSARRKSIDLPAVEVTPKKQKNSVTEQMSDVNKESKRMNKLKKKHLSTLGLQAIEGESSENKLEESVVDDKTDQTQAVEENKKNKEEQQMIESDDEQLEVTATLQSSEAESSTSDDEYVPKSRRAETSDEDMVLKKLRHRYHSRDGDISNENESFEVKRASKRSKPLSSASSVQEDASDHETPEGDEGQLGVEPAKPDQLYGNCTCEEDSNVFASEDDCKDPLFCGAIWSVGEIRVGCSSVSGGGPLRRAGPRTPYLQLCGHHRAMLTHHMCCAACGLFTAQGIFYQCSKGHFFHLECGVGAIAKCSPGCPHCGVYDHWKPANRNCWKVKVNINSKSKTIYLPEQRVDFSPSYLSFSKLQPETSVGPVIPPDLLPTSPVNLKALCEGHTPGTKLNDEESVNKLKQAILEFQVADKLIPMIASIDVNTVHDSAAGSTLVHVASSIGNLTALYLLHYAGANIDAADAQQRTPLIVAVQALVENCESSSDSKCKSKDKMDLDEDDKEVAVTENKEQELEDNLVKVIRYLISAGCDVDFAGVEGETALHVAAGGGAVRAVRELVHYGHLEGRDLGGWTPLVWAAENNHQQVVKVLLDAGADPQPVDGEGNAAIHWCCARGADRALLSLLDAEPLTRHALNANADTPLHVAARQGHYSCVVILLARGARTDLENSASELPVEVCGGECQTAISLNMQVELAIKDKFATYKLLSSDLSRGRESLPVACVNEVDETPLPADFTYVTDYVTTTHVNVDNTVAIMQGCTCAGSCSSGSCACVVVGVRGWWEGGRLVPSFPYHDPPMLFQCNYMCSCDQRKCQNSCLVRSRSMGSALVRVEVFRTRAAGWGLRSKGRVRRGTPVLRYCGELLPAAVADVRNVDHYTFSLDLKDELLEQCEDKVQLCVDACKFGSCARFVNHSCRPNLAPVRVFTSTRDLRAPDITLFAVRDIRPNEELTFDYGDKFWSVKSKHMKCECGSPGCRYPDVVGDKDTS